MAKLGGLGVQFKITITASLTLIAQAEDIEIPEQEAMTTEVTTHDSASGYAEFIKTGLFRLSKFNVTLIWDDSIASHTGVLAALAATASVTMTVTTPATAEVISFSGFVTKLGRESKKDNALRCKVEIQPTGVPTIT